MGQKKDKILIVDDTQLNREILRDILEDTYDILEAADGLEAVETLREHQMEVACVLLDIMMPKMDGYEVLLVMHKNDWLSSIPVMMISAETSSTYIDHAYDLGATDYITRPFDEKVVRRRVQNTIMLYAKQKSLENLVTEQIIEKERNNYEMIELLSNIVEFRNGESGLHVLHIRVITNILLSHVAAKSDRYDLSAEQVALISNASALHDIGKISIPAEILNKPGKLTRQEFEVMKTHTVIGAQILEDNLQMGHSELLRVAHDICRWHHERYDGKGYPDGLVGEEIPIAAQVVAVADVYDALTSERVYKPAFTHERAMQMIQNGECGCFSDFLLECLAEVGEQLKKELVMKSPRTLEGMELQRIAQEAFSHRELKSSNQTLRQLEREQIKNRFYRDTVRDITFEYDRKNDILELSDWGAEFLGIPKVIFHPSRNPNLPVWMPTNVVGQTDATWAEPMVSWKQCLRIRDKDEWFRVTTRTIWESEGDEECSCIVGCMTELCRAQSVEGEPGEGEKETRLAALCNQRAAEKRIRHLLRERGSSDYRMILVDVKLDREESGSLGVPDDLESPDSETLIRSVAGELLGCFRGEDVVARLDDGKFLVFAACPKDVSDSRLVRVWERLDGIAAAAKLSIHMGVARCPRDGESCGSLYRCADAALYAAQQTEGDGWTEYDPELPPRPGEPGSLGEDMDDAFI